MPVRHIALVVLIATQWIACAATEQARDVKFSGFLGDYSRLQPGGAGEPLYVYINQKADFRAYDKAFVEPAAIWRSKDADPNEVSPQDLKRLATVLEAKIIEALKHEGITLVRQPGPGVMKIRAALTEAQEASVAMDLVTAALPVPSVSKLATGTRAFAGKVSIEGEMSDSQTGEVLAAMVDRRAGARNPIAIRDSWADVEKALQYWSDRFAYRLCQLQSKAHCVPP